MEAISLDLRERVLKAYDEQKQSRTQIALRFAVSNSWIGKLLLRRRQTGSIEPKRPKTGKPPVLDGQRLQWVRELVEEQPDATLEELCLRLAERHQVSVSHSTLSRAMRRLELPLKKKSSTPASGIRRASRASARRSVRN
jgi:transposase